MRKIISVDFQIKDKQSADFIYQHCLKLAFREENFEVLCRKSFSVNDSDVYKNILDPLYSEGENFFNRFYSIFKNFGIIWNELQHHSDRKEGSTTIIQSFFTSEILIFLLIYMRIFFRKRDLKIKSVFICRFEISRLQYFLLRLIIGLAYISKKSKPLFFSDTEELCNIHSINLGGKCYLLPIPHTDDLFMTSEIKKRRSISVGFPGMPRGEKGSKVVRELAVILSKYDSFKIILQSWDFYISLFKDSNLNVDINFYKETREDYISYIRSCDLVMLPYSSENYILRSSGIFVESLCAGKIVIVPKNTWMAGQFKKMKLGRFIISFNDPEELKDLLDYINLNFDDVNQDFKSKCSHFRTFHSLNNFRRILESKIAS